jgi:peptidoglycan/LPS O-acetylase OafA/YrhL
MSRSIHAGLSGGMTADRRGIPTIDANAIIKPGRGDYRFLGGFRFLLAVCVLVSHAQALLPPGGSPLQPLSLGNVGVFLFFVLSGFVITEALEEFYRGRTGAFLLNRFLKIYPPYWVAAAITIGIDASTGTVNASLATIGGVVGNIAMFGQFLGITNYSVISITWAIIVELQFYALAALTFHVISVTSMRWVVLMTVSVLGIVGYMYVYTTSGFSRYYGSLQYAPYFITGVWLYYLRTKQNPGLSMVLVLASVAISLHSFVRYVGQNPEMNVFGAALLFLTLLALFGYLLWRGDRWINRNVDRHLGNATYFLYLIHTTAITFVAYLNYASGIAAFWLALVLSVVLAFVLFLAVESPLQLLRDRVRGKRLYA